MRDDLKEWAEMLAKGHDVSWPPLGNDDADEERERRRALRGVARERAFHEAKRRMER